MQIAPPDIDIENEIRARTAFENMIVAVLIAAGACGAAALLIDSVLALAKGAFGALLLALTDAVSFSFVIFLVGFGAAVAVGMPLYLLLEKARRRALWPYLLVALSIDYAALFIALGRAPGVDLETLLMLAPGGVIAVVFWRRMRPLWRKAEEKRANLRLVH